jgi:hypothetical protein
MNFNDIPGWFMPIDQAGFAWTLQFQNRTEPLGDLLELGTYRGKAAVLMGQHLRPDEVLTVCDLFDDVATHAAVDPTEQVFFRRDVPGRAEFERNYLAFHPALPRIVQGLTTEIVQHLAPGSVRFCHIDAGHTYQAVRDDIASARALVREGGVLAFDDWRKANTPGVSAAMWEAILNEGLRPVFSTDFKFYCTWGDPAPLQAEIVQRAAASGWAATAPAVQIRDLRVVHLHRRG